MPSVDKRWEKEIVCKEENFYTALLLKPRTTDTTVPRNLTQIKGWMGNYMSNLMSQTKLPIELLEEISKEFGFYSNLLVSDTIAKKSQWKPQEKADFTSTQH